MLQKGEIGLKTCSLDLLSITWKLIPPQTQYLEWLKKGKTMLLFRGPGTERVIVIRLLVAFPGQASTTHIWRQGCCYLPGIAVIFRIKFFLVIVNEIWVRFCWTMNWEPLVSFSYFCIVVCWKNNWMHEALAASSFISREGKGYFGANTGVLQNV